MRIITVGVMGSSKTEWDPYSVEVGELIARCGFNLLTGGGQGVMKSTSRAFLSVKKRMGKSIGVLPSEKTKEGTFIAKAGYPNKYIEIGILSPLGVFEGHDPDQISRNHINILSSDIIIALPGSKGTRNEINIAVAYKKPLILFGPLEQFDEFDLPKSNKLVDIKAFLMAQE